MIDYDLNGNMTTMKDKGIKGIVYNYLNLPNTFSITYIDPFGLGQATNAQLGYLYRADGTKLRKTHTIYGRKGFSGSTRITDYLDGFQYDYNEGGGLCLTCRSETAFEEQAYKNINDVLVIGGPPEWKLDFVPTSEGFYSFTENRYIYQYRDHLGNARVSFAKNSEGILEVTDTNNYYPFGLNHIQGMLSNSKLGSYYSYKYNGKELQETGMYDYGARFYMPDLGRWGVHDPLSDATFQPYNYANNNPTSFNDPTGMIGERSNNYIASTDVVRNKNGSYTVVGAYDDGDTNIYIVNNATNKKRTGEVIGATMRPCDFCTTNDKTGGLGFDKNISGVTFNLNNLTVSGTAKDKSGRSAELEDMDASALLEWIKQYYMNTINGDMPGTPYGWLEVLRELSANGAILDVKASMGLSPYTAIGNGKNSRGKPIITTLRAMGNMGFGANMKLAKPPIAGKNTWYKAIMYQAGQYNQSQNGGNGYNPGYPYYGEHSYSGGYIYFGYFRQFYKK